MLILHIFFALTSILLGTIALIRPMHTALRLSYAGTLATLASGIYLALGTPSHLASVCQSGLLYLTCITVLLVMARRRLQIPLHAE